MWYWYVAGGGSVFITFLLYACLVVGARADARRKAMKREEPLEIEGVAFEGADRSFEDSHPQEGVSVGPSSNKRDGSMLPKV